MSRESVAGQIYPESERSRASGPGCGSDLVRDSTVLRLHTSNLVSSGIVIDCSCSVDFAMKDQQTHSIVLEKLRHLPPALYWSTVKTTARSTGPNDIHGAALPLQKS